MAVPTYHDATSGNMNAATSVVVTMPTNTNGDLLLAVVTVCQLTTAITPPGGWVQLQSLDNGSNTQAAYVRTASSEPSTYTWSWTGSKNGHWVVMSIGSPHGTTPIAGFANVSLNTGAPVLPNIAFAATADMLLVGMLSCGRSTAVNAIPSGFTEVEQPNVGGGSGSDSSIGSFVYKSVTAGGPSTAGWSLNNGTLGQVTQFAIIAAGTAVMSARQMRVNGGSSTSLAVSAPFCYAGDRLYAAVQWNLFGGSGSSITITPPSGWTAVGAVVASGVAGHQTFEKVADGSEVGTAPVFTLSAAPTYSIIEAISMPSSGEVGTRSSAIDTSFDAVYDIPAMTLAAQTPAAFLIASVLLLPGNRFINSVPSGYLGIDLYVNSSPLCYGALIVKGQTAANPAADSGAIGNGTTGGPNITLLRAYALGAGGGGGGGGSGGSSVGLIVG